MAVGYAAAFSRENARRFLEGGVVGALVTAFAGDGGRAACAWAMGQIGRHAQGGADAVVAQGGAGAMVRAEGSRKAGEEELRAKCRKALGWVIQNWSDAAALTVIGIRAKGEIRTRIADRIAEIGKKDGRARD
jgi:hypothetical protein